MRHRGGVLLILFCFSPFIAAYYIVQALFPGGKVDTPSETVVFVAIAAVLYVPLFILVRAIANR
jgi:hypothetical protein